MKDLIEAAKKYSVALGCARWCASQQSGERHGPCDCGYVVLLNAIRSAQAQAGEATGNMVVDGRLGYDECSWCHSKAGYEHGAECFVALQEEVSKLRAELAKSKQHLDIAESGLDQYRLQINGLRAELAEARKHYDSEVAAHKVTQDKWWKAEAERDEWKRNAQEADESLQRNEVRMLKFKAERDSLIKAVGDHITVRAEYQEKVQALTAERDHYKSEAVSSWEGMRRAKNERDSLAATIEKIGKCLSVSGGRTVLDFDSYGRGSVLCAIARILGRVLPKVEELKKSSEGR